MTHTASDGVAPSSRAMLGSVMFTTVPSSTAMAMPMAMASIAK